MNDAHAVRRRRARRRRETPRSGGERLRVYRATRRRERDASAKRSGGERLLERAKKAPCALEAHIWARNYYDSMNKMSFIIL
jgi:hypothetical protein